MTHHFTKAMSGLTSMAVVALALIPSASQADVLRPRMSARANPNPTVLPIGSSAYGRTYSEWSVLWWQWFLPLTGEQFAQCAVGRSGPVAFLLAGPPACNVQVPSGTALFFPIATVECSNLEPAPFHGDTPNQRAACAASWIGLVGDIAVEIDGVALQNLTGYAVLSPDFDFTVGPDNVFGIPCSSECSGKSSGAGYYLMLAPLSAGAHEMHITAAGFGIDTRYTLTVSH